MAPKSRTKIETAKARRPYAAGPLWGVIKKRREEALEKWTADAIARRANMDPSDLYAALRRERVVSKAEATGIARALGISTADAGRWLVIGG